MQTVTGKKTSFSRRRFKEKLARLKANFITVSFRHTNFFEPQLHLVLCPLRWTLSESYEGFMSGVCSLIIESTIHLIVYHISNSKW